MAGIKFFFNGMGGATAAPSLNGAAGSLAALLDAILIDGFDTVAMTSGAIAGGVATINFAGSHSSEVGTTILVAGATPASLNGEQKVTAKTATSVSFATAEANGSITGSVTIKMAPLGWTKAFTGVNKRAYKSADVAATGHLLRVDDTGTTTARVVGYESMTDVDTGLGPFPTNSQMAGGLYWGKSSTADTVARSWMAWGDERIFYFQFMGNGNTWGPIFCFGDTVPVRAGDPYSCLLTGDSVATINSNTSTTTGDCGVASTVLTHNAYMPRSFNGIGGAVQCGKYAAMCTAQAFSGASGYSSIAPAYPNGPDNGLVISPIDVFQSSPIHQRARLPGLYHSPQNIAAVFSNRDMIDGTGDYTGKRMMVVRPGSSGTGASPGSNFGTAFMDLTGPWR